MNFLDSEKVIMKDVYICGALRTPLGSFGSILADFCASDLTAPLIKSLLGSTHLEPSSVEELILGQVLVAGGGQAPVRQAALKGSLLPQVRSLGVSRVCGSALQAVILATQSIGLGESDVVMAGGMESMSRAPHLLSRVRGRKMVMGELVLKDHMLYDGLTDAYDHHPMGRYGELCAQKYGFSRELQDEYALESYRRAQRATEEGWFDGQIIPLIHPKTSEELGRDEEPFRFKDLTKIMSLKPLFAAPGEKGTVTAGNASSLNDGAAVLLLASEKAVKTHNLVPLARVVGSASYGGEPKDFPTAPIPCIRKLMEKTGCSVRDVDLWEINEAFAVVSLAAMKELSLPWEKVNVHGGAVSLGHPIGGSGARILVTLIHALKHRELKCGVAALCIGGGEAVSMMVQRL